jgi:hypothetical protein
MEQDSKMVILEAQIRDCFGRVVWTHKTQEKCADILNTRNSCIKICQIVLSAITTTGIMITAFGDNKWVGVVSAIISAALLALNTFTKNYDLGQIAQKHADSAANLWNVRESYLSLLTDLKAQIIDVESILQRRDNLQIELKNIYLGAPRTINKAYTMASKALKTSEDLTFSDDEIDNFLPTNLRKKHEV